MHKKVKKAKKCKKGCFLTIFFFFEIDATIPPPLGKGPGYRFCAHSSHPYHNTWEGGGGSISSGFFGEILKGVGETRELPYI